MDRTGAKKLYLDFFADGRQEKFDRGQVIMPAGEEPKSVYWIAEGFVKAVSYSYCGNERSHFLFGPGELFSNAFLFERTFPQLEFVAASNVKTKSMSMSETRKFIEKNPQAMIFNLNIIIDVIDRLYCMQLEKASDRVTYTLFSLAKRFGSKNGDKYKFFELPLTQQELADIVRMSRETVGKEVSKLEADKSVMFGHKMIMVNMDKLESKLKDI